MLYRPITPLLSRLSGETSETIVELSYRWIIQQLLYRYLLKESMICFLCSFIYWKVDLQFISTYVFFWNAPCQNINTETRLFWWEFWLFQWLWRWMCVYNCIYIYTHTHHYTSVCVLLVQSSPVLFGLFQQNHMCGIFRRRRAPCWVVASKFKMSDLQCWWRTPSILPSGGAYVWSFLNSMIL